MVPAVAEPPIAALFEVQLPLPALPPAPQSASKKPVADSPVRRSTAPPTPAPQAPPQPATTQPDPRLIDKPVPPPADPQPADSQLPTADANPFDANRDGSSNRTRGAIGGTGGGDNVDDVALPVGGAITRPQIIPGTKAEPHYTELARQARLQGVVILQATIDERGNVVDIQVLKRLRFGLDEEAVKAVSQWKFTPALLHGRPVKVFFNLTVQFEVR